MEKKPLTKHFETRGRIKIKIYPPYRPVVVQFRSLGERVFKPFS